MLVDRPFTQTKIRSKFHVKDIQMRFSPLEPQFMSAYFVSFEHLYQKNRLGAMDSRWKNFDFFFITDTFLEMTTVFFPDVGKRYGLHHNAQHDGPYVPE
jgi:hypothetical protein